MKQFTEHCKHRASFLFERVGEQERGEKLMRNMNEEVLLTPLTLGPDKVPINTIPMLLIAEQELCCMVSRYSEACQT